MKPLIHIYGASGSGTSTLERYLVEKFNFAFLDSDDYFWLPTDPKFTTKRPLEQRVPLMRRDIAAAPNGAVVAGSLVGWGDTLIPDFTLAVRVVTDTPTRLARVRAVRRPHFAGRRYVQVPSGVFAMGTGTMTAAQRPAALPYTAQGKSGCLAQFL